MTKKEHQENMKFSVGDEIWWFQSKSRISELYMRSNIAPDTIELVHDVITDIQDKTLICWHGSHLASEVWGKTRQEAWDRLKREIEKWGSVE